MVVLVLGLNVLLPSFVGYEGLGFQDEGLCVYKASTCNSIQTSACTPKDNIGFCLPQPQIRTLF